MDDFVLFIVNTTYEANNTLMVERIYDQVMNDIPHIDMKIAYSNPLIRRMKYPKSLPFYPRRSTMPIYA
jgi:hypothetical protein